MEKGLSLFLIPPPGGEDEASKDLKRMTSLEIAKVTNKNHKDVLRAIRSMEEAWFKECGRKFTLTSDLPVQMPNGGVRYTPCYLLDMCECMYIATKFNDSARAKLVLRWAELEMMFQQQQAKRLEELTETNNELTQALLAEKTDAEYCRETLQSRSTFSVQQIAYPLGMTAQELNTFLCCQKIQYGRKGSYLPYEYIARKGYTRTRTCVSRHRDGTISTRHFTTWTEAGVRFITELVEQERMKMRPAEIQLTIQFL